MAEPELVGSCHCGRATIRLARRPDYVNQCNCTVCEKTGWRGVYLSSDELTIAGEFDSYVRSDIQQPMIRLLRCRNCGIATHWTPLGEPPYERMGVNARLLDPAVLKGLEVREVDGRSWDS
jgi:hypothetical protein